MDDQVHDKYSIKNILFNRAIPNYTAAVASEHANKLHICLDCGDRFIMESSLLNHINRKSMKITYRCRSCNHSPRKVFFNRCNLLSHIRSHVFKTVTIEARDLKIDPLPFHYFHALKQKIQTKPRAKATTTAATSTAATSTAATSTAATSTAATSTAATSTAASTFPATCDKCGDNVYDNGFKGNRTKRKLHYMKKTNQVHICPVCLFSVPNVCALKAHIRIHLKLRPCYCPECGCMLSSQSLHYPFLHYCEGFNMIRATARYKCPVEGCSIFPPISFKSHLMTNHMKKVYKCPSCDVACFSESTILKHMSKMHIHLLSNVTIFYQCELCPGRLVVQNLMDRHLKSHITDSVYPCWKCGAICRDVPTLLDHHLETHNESEEMNQSYASVSDSNCTKTYRVVKRCDRCQKTFAYKCSYKDIDSLPNVCPNKCCEKPAVKESPNNTISQIMCTFCKMKISEDWEDIKKHYASCHENYKCLDVKVRLIKMDMKKYLRKYKKFGCPYQKPKRKSTKRNNRLRKVKKLSTQIKSVDKRNSDTQLCNICQYSCTEEEFQIHIKEHRDPSLAYQCKECGKCFAVKPSFSTHLLMEHDICNVDEYILNKQCYNDDALSKKLNSESELKLPLNENQCKICREQYNNKNDLAKHFRVHGMAFLKKNQNK